MLNQDQITDLSRFRQELHSRAELSGAERITAALVKSRLETLGPDKIISLAETGLAAIWQGAAPGPTLLFRCELDALPIPEENSFAHRSLNPEVSHKCGHDGHAAILMGLAQLVGLEPPKRGKLVLLFQPAEETGQGARSVLEDENFPEIEPEYVFALHNLPGYPQGTVVIRPGPFTAAVCTLVIRLQGKSAHAAEPENGINPVWLIADIIRYSRERENPDVTSESFCLITIVHVKVGEKAYGTAPGSGEIHLTLRAWDTAQLHSLTRDLTDWATENGTRQGLEVETTLEEEFAANVNNAYAVQLIEEVARKNGLVTGKAPLPFRWGEDFGLFTGRYAGAMFGLGAGENCPPLHHPAYDFPDEILPVGVMMFFGIAQSILS
ncbi:MAG: amidohydrolase [Bacteroidia bacterium]|nr:amidohydrolase [Bacteroidia bacterium]